MRPAPCADRSSSTPREIAAARQSTSERNLRRRTRAIVAVARGAVLQVQRRPLVARRVSASAAGPREVVGVHVIAGRSPDRTPGRPTPRRRRSRERRPSRCPTVSGTNRPSLRNVANRSSAHWCASGVRVVSMSSVSSWRANGAGFVGNGCVSRGDFAGHVARRKLAILDRKQRLAVRRGRTRTRSPACVVWATASIVRPSRLTVTSVGRRRKVAIPDVVAHALEMPDALAGVGVEREQGVGEEVVARGDSRRRSPPPPIRSARRRCRAPRRAPCPASCWPPPL